MDEKFQDRIDDFLLNRMGSAEKEVFLQEVEQDEEKKAQLEFTKNVKDAICSREEKLQVLAQFKRQYEEERRGAEYRDNRDVACARDASMVAAKGSIGSIRRIWLWASGVAAVLVIGLFAVNPIFDIDTSPVYDSIHLEQMRGGDNGVSSAAADTVDCDTVMINDDDIQ